MLRLLLTLKEIIFFWGKKSDKSAKEYPHWPRNTNDDGAKFDKGNIKHVYNRSPVTAPNPNGNDLCMAKFHRDQSTKFDELFFITITKGDQWVKVEKKQRESTFEKRLYFYNIFTGKWREGKPFKKSTSKKELSEFRNFVKKRWIEENNVVQADYKHQKITSPLSIYKFSIPEGNYGNTIHVDSFTENGIYYKVDIRNQECTCPDFVKRRISFEKNDFRRLCKHLIKAIYEMNEFSFMDQPFKLLVKRAIVLKKNPYSESIKTASINDMNLLICHKESSDWFTVITRSRGKLGSQGDYCEYGYNPHEKRWSYGSIPPFSKTIKKLIDSW